MKYLPMKRNTHTVINQTLSLKPFVFAVLPNHDFSIFVPFVAFPSVLIYRSNTQSPTMQGQPQLKPLVRTLNWKTNR